MFIVIYLCNNSWKITILIYEKYFFDTAFHKSNLVFARLFIQQKRKQEFKKVAMKTWKVCQSIFSQNDIISSKI